MTEQTQPVAPQITRRYRAMPPEGLSIEDTNVPGEPPTWDGQRFTLEQVQEFRDAYFPGWRLFVETTVTGPWQPAEEQES